MKTDTLGVQPAYRCQFPNRHYSDAATLTSANGTPVEGQVINWRNARGNVKWLKVRTNSSGQAPVVRPAIKSVHIR